MQRLLAVFAASAGITLLAAAGCDDGRRAAAPAASTTAQADRPSQPPLAGQPRPLAAPARSAQIEPWRIHPGSEASPIAVTGVPRPSSGGIDRLWVSCVWSNGESMISVTSNLSVLPDQALGRALDQARRRDLAWAATITVDGPRRQVFRPDRLTLGQRDEFDLAETEDFYEVVVRFMIDTGPRRPGELAPGDAAFLHALADARTIRFDLTLDDGQRLTSTFTGADASAALAKTHCPKQ